MIGVVGYGAMGSAIIKGILKTSKENILVFDPHKKDNLDGVTFCENLEYLVKNSTRIIVATKPNKYKEVLSNISRIRKDIFIISIAVGYEISKIKADLGIKDAKVIRTMPNTPAQILEGVVGMCKSNEVSEEEFSEIKKLFSSFSKVYDIEEDEMHIFSAISGSMPAFVDIFIEAVADAAVYEGMQRAKAYSIISNAISGSAKLVSETNTHPASLKDNVTSPAGTTICGVYELEKNGFRKSIMKAIISTTKKSKEMEN